ncbi:glutathione synthetase [Algoriphagus aestuarii]|nr:glutathione synthetase [Algoriphagus aestuarii]
MIAIVSYYSVGAYDSNTVNEDEILSSILDELGFPNQVVPWSDQDVKWGDFRAILIKSTWDYFDYYDQFLEWIEKIHSLKIPVLNDLNTIRWNSSKNYLSEIKEKGFAVISGQELKKGSKISTANVLENVVAETLVVKPMVSGGAKNTLKLKKSEWGFYSDKIQSFVNEEDFLVQPFIKEVQEVGEFSLIFFNAKFSHAVLKTPASGDFRVQHYFGGQIKSILPSEKMESEAKAFISEFAPESLYARVDGVEIDGVFHLMELELIEPYLFLTSHPKAIQNYQEALKKRLG